MGHPRSPEKKVVGGMWGGRQKGKKIVVGGHCDSKKLCRGVISARKIFVGGSLLKCCRGVLLTPNLDRMVKQNSVYLAK